MKADYLLISQECNFIGQSYFSFKNSCAIIVNQLYIVAREWFTFFDIAKPKKTILKEIQFQDNMYKCMYTCMNCYKWFTTSHLACLSVHNKRAPRIPQAVSRHLSALPDTCSSTCSRVIVLPGHLRTSSPHASINIPHHGKGLRCPCPPIPRK